ncbi:hypothetical protein [Vibrio coralliilyticus]|uniref:hypothetical protein n=1 Tax=Vibrio coralliilyticus TaxID=190893 RepID=UPI001E636D1E|nr:hypothetical protein [Vibrio coralliilyticus]MCC2525562.1 hypothetical protein [Vibrio coralliilyticus]
MEKSDTFVPNPEKHIVRGDKENAVGAYYYLAKGIDEKTVERSITIYFSEFNKSYQYDLCPEFKGYNALKTKITDNTTGNVEFIHEEKQVDCMSTLTVAEKKNNHVLVTLDMKRLDGYRVSFQNGVEDHFPIVTETKTSFMGHKSQPGYTKTSSADPSFNIFSSEVSYVTLF